MIRCPRCGGPSPIVYRMDRAEGYERRRICTECGYAFATLEALERELTEEEKHPQAPGCCVTCCHYRAGKAQDCDVFKTTAGIRDDQCGMQSPI